MAEGFYPHLFVTGIQLGDYVPPYAFIKARVFAATAPPDRAFLKPRVFAAGIDLRETATADTLRRISNSSWQAEETATADTQRNLLDIATADTLRQLELPEIATADTLIRRPHELRYVVETPARRLLKAAPAQSLVNSFKDYDVVSLSVTLNERTLSDNFNLETAQEMEIGDAVKGMLLDYPFSFLVEKTRKQGLIQTVNGMYDQDKQLYTHVWEAGESSAFDSDSTTMKASEYIQHIASYFGLTPNVKIQDFTPSNATKNTNITYSDLISTLFTWTAQLPQRQINVFIRGGTLHVIQRGLEDLVVDISDWRHSRPTVDKELVRTMWKNANDDGSGNSEDDNKAEPFSGTIYYSDKYSSNTIVYGNGLLRSEEYYTHNNKVASVENTTYSYMSDTENGEKSYYLLGKSLRSTTIENEDVEVIHEGYPKGKTLTKTVIEGDTQYQYAHSNDGVYLVKEYETECKTTYLVSGYIWKLSERETTDRQVTHVPAGNGWYATSVYVNGVHQGSSLSQGKPSNEVSLYTVERSHLRVSVEPSKPLLSPIDTTSFPVEESEILTELVEALDS